jgi:hypothetical protein
MKLQRLLVQCVGVIISRAVLGELHHHYARVYIFGTYSRRWNIDAQGLSANRVCAVRGPSPASMSLPASWASKANRRRAWRCEYGS